MPQQAPEDELALHHSLQQQQQQQRQQQQQQCVYAMCLQQLRSDHKLLHVSLLCTFQYSTSSSSMIAAVCVKDLLLCCTAPRTPSANPPSPCQQRSAATN
jgi:hypothetical protein